MVTEKLENLGDLRNDFRETKVSSDDEIKNFAPPPEVPEDIDREIDKILEDSGRDEIAYKSLVAMGGQLKIGHVPMPPPTVGVLSLLDALKNPFITGKADEISIHELHEAVYVMFKGPEAVQPVFEHVRRMAEIEKNLEIAEKSPEFYDVWLKYASSAAARRAEFDTEIEKFAESLGIFDPKKAIKDIYAYLNACMEGFEMVPDNSGKVKKNALRSMLTGLCQLWPLVRTSCVLIIKLWSGKLRFQ